MAAQAERPLNVLSHASARERMSAALYACLALFTVAIGVLGLQGDSWLRQALEAWINIHALFGLLLCGLVFALCIKRSPRMLSVDIRELSRRLSRIVYLLLYVVIGATEATGVLHSLWHGGPVNFAFLDLPLRDGSHPLWFNPEDDFQRFFTAGLIALLFVRILAFTLRWRAAKRSAVLEAATATSLARIEETLGHRPAAR